MKKWMWIVLAAVVFTLAGGGVLCGVLTHDEPGLMKVCWSNNTAVYSDSCKLDLKWRRAQLPLKYYISFGVNHKTYVKSVVGAADMWNKEIGPVFTRVDKAEDAHIQVSWGSQTPGKHTGGCTTHTGDEKGPTGAHVVLSEPSDTHAVYRHAAHEFGHVLGLAHDKAPRSIMYKEQPGVTVNMTLVLPSDSDKKLLQELYIE